MKTYCKTWKIALYKTYELLGSRHHPRTTGENLHAIYKEPVTKMATKLHSFLKLCNKLRQLIRSVVTSALPFLGKSSKPKEIILAILMKKD